MGVFSSKYKLLNWYRTNALYHSEYIHCPLQLLILRIIQDDASDAMRRPARARAASSLECSSQRSLERR